MGKKIIGIDIQSNGVSAVLLNSGLRENRIENAIYAPLPVHREEEGLASALNTISGAMSLDDAVCVAAIPPEKTACRNVRMPFKGNKKIAQIIPFELEPTLPFPIDRQVIDFHSLDLPDPGDQTEILAMTADASDIKTVIDELETVRLDPLRISLGSYATVQCLSWLKPMPPCWIMLHLGRNYITLFLVLHHQVAIVRTFPCRLSGEKQARHIENTIQQTLFALEDRFSSNETPKKLVLTGPGSRQWDNSNSRMIERNLGITVEKADLTAQADSRIKRPPNLAWDGPNYDSALALALTHAEGKNGCNFRQGAYATRKDWNAQKPLLIRLGIFALVLLLLAGTNLMIDSMSTQKKIDRLDSRITAIFRSTLPDVTRIVAPLQQMQVAINETRKPGLSSDDSGMRIPAIDILKAVSENIPAGIDVEITRMVIGEDDILVSGNTDTFNAANLIQSKLEPIPFFKKVTISSTNKDKKTSRIRFKIKVDL